MKTNIPFLINVLNHEVFQEGKCYTNFIEDTPELFDLRVSQDRATKILEFLGNKMVNVSRQKSRSLRIGSCRNTTHRNQCTAPGMNF